MTTPVIVSVEPLGFPWRTFDPFLFCVHHDDAYPKGNALLGPAASLAGRDIGQDFTGKDGWRMYHGDVVPGFPQHPHRGFETVTMVRRGLIDHSDSLGATARFGHGDVQWLTAGRGIVHAEMFPLVEEHKENPLELFQIWLNLPAADKLAPPHFTMLWNEKIPRTFLLDERDRDTEIVVVAGRIHTLQALAPPPRSWAARPDSDVAIVTLKLSPNAHFTLPPAEAGSNRALYFFRGDSLKIAAQSIPPRTGIKLNPAVEAQLENGPRESELLLLQGRPIGEPIAQSGPFVMNTRAELQQAFTDFQRTRFGGWPWPTDAPVHPRSEPRFAREQDGPIDRPL